MRIILFSIFIICSLSSTAQTSYITTTGDIYLESGAIEKFDAPVFFVSHTYYDRSETYLITIELSTGVVSASSPIVEEFTLRATKADIDAYTGTGTGDTAKCHNAVDQYVAAYLHVINGSSTITIH